MSDDESYNNDNASVISNISCSTSVEEQSCMFYANVSINSF